jgi:hypothetical protein
MSTKNDILGALDSYPNVKVMLKGISRQLWYIFLPDNVDDLAMLEADILAQKKRDVERNKVMAIQNLCGFMLHPNEPLREVIVQAKKEGLSEDDLPRNNEKDKPNPR